MYKYIVVSLLLLPLLTACGSEQSTQNSDDIFFISSTSPLIDDFNVSSDTQVSITFAQDMLATSIDNMSFSLSANEKIASQVSFNGDSNTATLTPDNRLALNTTYTAKLDQTVADIEGNSFTDFEFSFTTSDGQWASTRELHSVDTPLNIYNKKVSMSTNGQALAAWIDSPTNAYLRRFNG